MCSIAPTRRVRWTIWGIALAVVAPLGCGGEASVDATPTATNEPAASPAPPPKSAPPGSSPVKNIKDLNKRR